MTQVDLHLRLLVTLASSLPLHFVPVMDIDWFESPTKTVVFTWEMDQKDASTCCVIDRQATRMSLLHFLLSRIEWLMDRSPAQLAVLFRVEFVERQDARWRAIG